VTTVLSVRELDGDPETIPKERDPTGHHRAHSETPAYRDSIHVPSLETVGGVVTLKPGFQNYEGTKKF